MGTVLVAIEHRIVLNHQRLDPVWWCRVADSETESASVCRVPLNKGYSLQGSRSVPRRQGIARS